MKKGTISNGDVVRFVVVVLVVTFDARWEANLNKTTGKTSCVCENDFDNVIANKYCD